MSTHAMIDIETLGTMPNSVILSVGAVKFDPFKSDEPHDGRHWKIDVDAQTSKGRFVDEKTLAWWSKQEKDIQNRAFSDQFDMVILEDFFRDFVHHMNWFYWQVSDCRTLFKMMPQDPRKQIQEDLHDAQADAHWQAVCVQQFYRDYKVLPKD